MIRISKAVQSAKTAWKRVWGDISRFLRWAKTEPSIAAITLVVALAGTSMAGRAFCASLPQLDVTVESIDWRSGLDAAPVLEHLNRIQQRHDVGPSLYDLEDIAREFSADLSAAESYSEFMARLEDTPGHFIHDPCQRVAAEFKRLKEEVESMYSADWLVATVHIQNRSSTANAVQSAAGLRISHDGKNSTTVMYLQGESNRLDAYEGRRFEFRSPSTIDFADTGGGKVGRFAIVGIHGKLWKTEWIRKSGTPRWPVPDYMNELEAALDEHLTITFVG